MVRCAETARIVIFLDLLFNSLLGIGFALAARDRLRADGPFAAPAFLLVLSFVGVVLVPVTLYLYLAHPAWTWMYLVDPADVPALAVVPLLVLHGCTVIVSWYVAALFVRAEKVRGLIYALGVGVVALAVAGILLSGRLMQYGTYQDYKRSITLDLMEVKLGYVLVALILGTGTAAGFVAFELFRDSRRVRTR